jgi:hypothetical protein
MGNMGWARELGYGLWDLGIGNNGYGLGQGQGRKDINGV